MDSQLSAAPNCPRCDAHPPLLFDENYAAAALPTWTCFLCGLTFFDASKYRPIAVAGVVYVRRGALNVVAHPVRQN